MLFFFSPPFKNATLSHASSNDASSKWVKKVHWRRGAVVIALPWSCLDVKEKKEKTEEWKKCDFVRGEVVGKDARQKQKKKKQ